MRSGTATDTTGPAVANLLRESLRVHIHAAEILPDGKERLADRLRHYADEGGIDLVIAAGGTGPAPRDQTPEAVREVVERLTPGFDEVMRHASLASTPLAMLSRACSGIRGSTLILPCPAPSAAPPKTFAPFFPRFHIAWPSCAAIPRIAAFPRHEGDRSFASAGLWNLRL